MSESQFKMMKFTENLPADVVEHIFSFSPIKSLLQYRGFSKSFKKTKIRSRDLDFSKIYSKRRSQKTVVRIIEDIFNKHEGLEINRFVLIINHLGVEDKILTWINTCLGKNVQELELDFSKSRKLLEIPIDFSAIETLTVLKLRWCKFEIPNNSPKGLKLLRTLALMKTKVTKEMIDAIFTNCIHLEALELTQCRMYRTLSINAQNHKKFKSLVVYSIPNIYKIILDAPTLECYKYEGYVRMVYFSKVDALKEAKLHYTRCYDWNYYNPFSMVIANMGVYTRVHVLNTTNIFLEAIIYGFLNGEITAPAFCFQNLQEFQICFKPPTHCTLFDIAEFLILCPNLKRVVIDINDFTFESLVHWELRQKALIENDDKYGERLSSIKFVDIKGFKNHWHELDIVEFFVKNAKSLEELMLLGPTNPNIQLFELDVRRITRIRSLSRKEKLVQFF